MRMLAQLGLSDKIEHFAAYSLMALLPAVHERSKLAVAAAIGAVTLGIGLEFGQLYSPGRSFEIADMIADALGVCSGLALGTRLRSSRMVRSLLCVPEN